MVFDSFFDAATTPPKTADVVSNEFKKRNRKKNVKNDKKQEAERSTLSSHSLLSSSQKRPPASSCFQRPQQHHKKQRRTTRTPPSAEALDLSRQLKECSRMKRLDRALQLYESDQFRSILDEHHACIVIDCCARCGQVETAVSIARPFLLAADPSIRPPNVETVTALLKAYAHHHGGRYMKDCLRLFETTIDQANVRTLNTVLRGCLWTPVDAHGFGGVQTSETAWRLYFTKHSINPVSVGPSAFEYSIILLCQALRVAEAHDRIRLFLETFKLQYKGAAGFHISTEASIDVSDEEQAVMETMAVAHASLAKAYALLGKSNKLWTATQRALCAIRLSRQRLIQQQQNDLPTTVAPTNVTTASTSKTNKTRYVLSGGKQGWKGLGRTQEADSARVTSNLRYRLHRLDEIERDMKDIIKVRSNLPSTTQIGKFLQERLWWEGDPDPSSSSRSCLATCSDVATWKSFGLSQLEHQKNNNNNKSNKTRDKNQAKAEIPPSAHASFIGDDGRLNCTKIFGNENPIELEIGSGFGSWIVHRAKENRDRNYIAIEMKADRVAQIISRCALEQLSNISVVGADCLSFLRRYIGHDSLTNVYANHPEPPTQTFGMRYDQDQLDRIANGDFSSEPSHMLRSEALMQVASCLMPKSSGRFTIVTDNRNYVRLLTATVACAIIRIQRRKHPIAGSSTGAVAAPMLASIGPDRICNPSLSLMDSPTFWNGKMPIPVHVYEGNAGCNGNGTSYFDKLWISGAGSHAERISRFFIVLERK